MPCCTCFPPAKSPLVKLATELLLLGFLMDDSSSPIQSLNRPAPSNLDLTNRRLHVPPDWFYHHPLAETTSVVSHLQSLLSSPSTFSPHTTIDRMHATLFARILAVPSSSSSQKVLEPTSPCSPAAASRRAAPTPSWPARWAATSPSARPTSACPSAPS
ncbi:hypothetical protein N658DRAFT_493765 [Parathielavia hyrcaniae]|uniref:Uncharacterized protein n=1 Tax=Parathielavia hyrcaniae TaxID=113614 RepID=A0AAN6T504_9PEZI|nr:hypothetical protein N658DRAFT_493765 [Parathielavia hyrcaniae]